MCNSYLNICNWQFPHYIKLFQWSTSIGSLFINHTENCWLPTIILLWLVIVLACLVLLLYHIIHCYFIIIELLSRQVFFLIIFPLIFPWHAKGLYIILFYKKYKYMNLMHVVWQNYMYKWQIEPFEESCEESLCYWLKRAVSMFEWI